MTDGLAYLAALLLAATFSYSAVTKFRDPRPVRRALERVGIPAPDVLTKAVPAIESVVAVMLVVRPALGAVLALGLLAIFTVFIGYLLARGIDVSCGCFGANATESVSVFDLVRNAFLVALALSALSVARPSAVALEEVMVITLAVAIGGVVLAAAKARQHLGQLFDNRLPGER